MTNLLHKTKASQIKPVLQTFKGLKIRKVHLLRFYYLQIVVGYVFKAYGNVKIFNIYTTTL